MSTSACTFDPLGVVVDWLDACRSGDLDALLDLYDERATQHCLCENVTLAGPKALAAYWAPKLKNKLGSAFTLDELAVIGDAVQVDYQGHEGKPLRIYFHFDPSGQIHHTSCRPKDWLEVLLPPRASDDVTVTFPQTPPSPA